jgi:hypothetical protein
MPVSWLAYDGVEKVWGVGLGQHLKSVEQPLRRALRRDHGKTLRCDEFKVWGLGFKV